MKYLVLLLIGLVFFTICGTIVVFTKMENPGVAHYLGAYSISIVFFICTLLEAHRISIRNK